ncbi:MAG: two-component system, OmpR family, sensor kinase [Solirubrobacteraceae bacterium]|nr:two-component system, OmpR family, sensor kinase [Solirubrobacteraceae bacterium]
MLELRARLSLRARVAGAAVVAIAVAVALLGVAVSALLGAQLTRSLDRSLRTRAVEVARVAASTPALLTAPGALEGRISGGALFVQVVDRGGRIVARSGGLGGRVLPGGAPLRGALGDRRAAYADGALGSAPIRLYVAPLGELGAGAAAGGAVLVAGTTSEIDDILSTTRRIILVCALVAAALAALLAMLLTGRALRPLRRLSGGARAIERSGDGSARLPAPSARDEVGELASTLNAMLASLERARASEQRFVADASHELRTPLTALRGNVAYVARHGPDSAVIADIQAGASRLSALLDDLLALAREDAASPLLGEPVALEQLARAAANADRDAVVVVEPGADGVRAVGERPALERAVSNLVRNARTHGPADGQITLTVGRHGDRARISVSDEGPGPPYACSQQVFERFWRGPGARGEGSGLGLAIVRAIAERHGGSVAVQGACFTIELPVLRDLSRSGRTTSP